MLGASVPLGAIVIKRSFSNAVAKQIDQLIRESIEHAFQHYPQISDYVQKHSQEMDEAVMRKHIDLYVNNYSLDVGDEGKLAVKKFLEIANYAGTEKIFVE